MKMRFKTVSGDLGPVLNPWPFVRAGNRVCFAYSELVSQGFMEVLECNNGVFNVGADQEWLVVDVDNGGLVRFRERVSAFLEEVAAFFAYRYSDNSVYTVFSRDFKGFFENSSGNAVSLVDGVYSNLVYRQYPLEDKACCIASFNAKKVIGFLFRATDERGSYELVVIPSSYELPVGDCAGSEFTKGFAAFDVVRVGELLLEENVNSLHFFFRRRHADLNAGAGCG